MIKKVESVATFTLKTFVLVKTSYGDEGGKRKKTFHSVWNNVLTATLGKRTPCTSA